MPQRNRLTEKPFVTNLLEFQRAFPDEDACLDYLELVRWPDGFACPKCGVVEEPYRIETRPRVLVCRDCRAETSITAGTIMHRTRMPLQMWFWGAYLVTSQTPGMSALQFQRQLGITRYETAFQMLHKLRAAMVRPKRDKIGKKYPVELDEAYVGGRTRGKGRGVTEKVIVAGAVEIRLTEKKDPRTGEIKARVYAGRLRLEMVPDRKKKTLEKFAIENIARGTEVVTDDWVAYDDFYKAYDHQPITLDAPAEEKAELMPLIHLVFSNLKTWLLGTHHGVSPKHLQSYLDEYVFRFNRRFYPMAGFHSVLGIAAGKKGPEWDELYSGERRRPNPGRRMDEPGKMFGCQGLGRIQGLLLDLYEGEKE